MLAMPVVSKNKLRDQLLYIILSIFVVCVLFLNILNLFLF